MASSNTPSTMEDKYFGYPAAGKSDIKVSDKSATKDFINIETSKHTVNIEPNLQNSIKKEPTKQDLAASDDSRKEEDSSSTPSNNPNVFVMVSNIQNETNTATVEVPVGIEPDDSIDENLPQTVTLLKTPDGGKCYIVGTSHFSLESQEDVSKIVQAVQPHVVMVELCQERISILLQLDEETVLNGVKDLNTAKILSIIKENGVYKGLFYVLLFNMTAHLTKVLGIAPGGEFRRALAEAKKVPNCRVLLGDRSIKITLSRALKSLTWWQSIKLAWKLITDKADITLQDVEKYKTKDMIEEAMTMLAGEYPKLGEVFIKERDIFLTNALQLACAPKIGPDGKMVPARVVGVVGIGHANGIISNWGKVQRADVLPLLTIPSPSLSSKIVTYTIKASLLGAVVYIAYKVIPIPTGLVNILKSSVTGLVKSLLSHFGLHTDTHQCDDYEHPLSNLVYVVSNIPGPGSQLEDFELEFSVGCSCEQECKAHCSCTRGIANYVDDRLNLENEGSIVECNSNCTCAESCGNRLVQRGPLDCLKVRRATEVGVGLGLFTTKLIRRGQFICEYAGEVIGIDEARGRFERNKLEGRMNYVLVVSEFIGDKKITTCIDPGEFGNVGRYANHSCQPNATLVPVRVDITIPRLCLFATKDIEPMAEITFNYAGDVADSVQNPSETSCLCGSAACLGYLPHCPM